MANVSTHVRRHPTKGYVLVSHYERRAPRLTKSDLEMLDELLSTDEGARYVNGKKVRNKIGKILDEMEMSK